MIKFEKKAKVAIVNSKGERNPYCGTDYDDESNYLTFKMWEKNGYKRIYANNYNGDSIGYIDCSNGKQIVSEYTKGDFFETMKFFRENYEF